MVLPYWQKELCTDILKLKDEDQVYLKVFHLKY